MDRLFFEAGRLVPWSPPPLKRRVGLPRVERELTADGVRRVRELQSRFDLSGWSRCCSRQEWRESLYVLDVLSRNVDIPNSGRALDVGSRAGSYLPGLATAVPLGWDLAEVDAYRRYVWGATRRAHGEQMAAYFPGCRYRACDVRALDGPWSLVTWFLPYVSEAPLRAAGLPGSLLKPRDLLLHVARRMESGGQLLVVNQGEAEAAPQRTLFEELQMDVRFLGRIESPLSPFVRRRFGWMWTKTDRLRADLHTDEESR